MIAIGADLANASEAPILYYCQSRKSVSTVDLTRELVNEWSISHKDEALSHWFNISTLDETPASLKALDVYCSENHVTFRYPDSVLPEANAHVESEARQQNLDPTDNDVHYRLLSDFIENSTYPLLCVNGQQITEQDVFSEPDKWYPFEAFQFTDNILIALMNGLTREDPLSPDSKVYREGVNELLRAGLSEDEILSYINTGALLFSFDSRDVADWCVDEVNHALKDALIAASFYRIPARIAQQNESLWGKATDAMIGVIKTLNLPDVTYKVYGVETKDIDRVLNLLEFKGVD